MIYLDNNATTEPLPEVKDAVIQALSLGPANPSSVHPAGEPARRLLAEARDDVASLIGASPGEIYFTSGGTEANNWALQVVAHNSHGKLLTTPVEHESILRKADMLKSAGTTVEMLPVDGDGVVKIEAAIDLISHDTNLVSVQWVNNETGVIQPVEQLSAICHSRGVAFHTDAAQAIGKLPVDVKSLEADYITFTGHKFHAPMGVGVLWSSSGKSLVPLFAGGMQESRQRPGTENLAGIAGLAMAAQIRRQRLANIEKKLAELRDAFEDGVLNACYGASVNAGSAKRVCNTTNIRFSDVDGQALVARLANQGICCSQGSACTAQIPEPSHVLLAMGMNTQQAYESIRFSFSELNGIEDVKIAVKTIAAAYKQLTDLFTQQSSF